MRIFRKSAEIILNLTKVTDGSVRDEVLKLNCFIKVCCCFTVRNHDVLLDYIGAPQWEPHGDNFT